MDCAAGANVASLAPPIVSKTTSANWSPNSLLSFPPLSTREPYIFCCSAARVFIPAAVLVNGSRYNGFNILLRISKSISSSYSESSCLTFLNTNNFFMRSISLSL